jgi:hypothetical protein
MAGADATLDLERALVEAQDRLTRDLHARAKAQGWILHIAAPGGFLAIRWSRVVVLADIAEVEMFLARVGGGHA